MRSRTRIIPAGWRHSYFFHHQAVGAAVTKPASPEEGFLGLEGNSVQGKNFCLGGQGHRQDEYLGLDHQFRLSPKNLPVTRFANYFKDIFGPEAQTKRRSAGRLTWLPGLLFPALAQNNGLHFEGTAQRERVSVCDLLPGACLTDSGFICWT